MMFTHSGDDDDINVAVMMILRKLRARVSIITAHINLEHRLKYVHTVTLPCCITTPLSADTSPHSTMHMSYH